MRGRKTMRLSRAIISFVLAALGLILLSLAPLKLRGQDNNQVALVVRHGDQEVQSLCVDIDAEEVTGLELLQQSGLNIALEVQGLGAAVCSIGNTGCPADDCWCQCQGGSECVYWSYWRQPEGAWQYSQAGASQVKVRDGDIQGWSWGPGAVTNAIAPPQLAFEDVCTITAEDTATATMTLTPTQTATVISYVPQDTSTPASSQAKPEKTATRAATATQELMPSSTPVSTQAATSTATISLPTAITTADTAPESAPNVQAPANEPVQPTNENGSTSAAVAELATPLPSPTPVPTATLPQQVAQTAAAALSVEAPVPQRLAKVGAKQSGSEQKKPAQEVSVVGSSVEMADQGKPQLQTTGNPMETAAEPFSPVPYLYFGLIVAGLLSLWLLTSVRQRRSG